MENFFDTKVDNLLKQLSTSILEGKSREELMAEQAAFIAESFKEYRSKGFFVVSSDYFTDTLMDAYRSRLGILFSLSA